MFLTIQSLHFFWTLAFNIFNFLRMEELLDDYELSIGVSFGLASSKWL